MVPSPASCTCCGSKRLSKVGEDVTETLEVIPRRWKVIQTVREKFACRDCEKLSQAPAPYHTVPRGWAGPNLLATIVFEKYGQHQPLNRQSERYAREGVELSVSTLADQVGACAFALRPLHELIAAHVLGAQRLHGDDTPVPVLAKGKTDTARAWVYVQRRRTVRRSRPASGAVPLLARPAPVHASGGASARLCRDSSGRRLRRIQPAVCAGAGPGAGDRSPLLGPRSGASSTNSPTSPPASGVARTRRRSLHSPSKR